MVSLFTREWIEIRLCCGHGLVFPVSLFTREWIEIRLGRAEHQIHVCLPLYEGVD